MQHYKHVMCAEGTMCRESYVALVLCSHCRPMKLGNDVMQHRRHVMCVEGTMSAEKYKALVLYTHCRPMVLGSNIT